MGRLRPQGKDIVVGRRLVDGSPITGHREDDVPDLAALDSVGFPAIEPQAHIRLAHATTPTETMLRRGYNYDEGPDAQGHPDVGLIFAAYQKDADTAFVPVQRRLAEGDLLNRWVRHIGSATFAIAPGCSPQEYVGQRLLEA
jgi:dye decolorizing peroxidase